MVILHPCFLSEDAKCFAFLAGHESFAAAEGAIKIAEKANKVRKEPLKSYFKMVLVKMLLRSSLVSTASLMFRLSLIMLQVKLV